MSRKTGWLTCVSLMAIAALLLAGCQPVPAAQQATNKLEMFSWWTAGGEIDGLNAMFAAYSRTHPGVEIVNATVTGGGGAYAKAVLATRLATDNPPDAFQVHAGLEVEKYQPNRYLQILDDLYATEGWEAAFPKDLIALLKYEGHFWGVPVNIHRANVLWYNKQIFSDNGLTPPTTWDEFFAVGDALKAKGIATPLIAAGKDGFEVGHVFETILAGALGAEDYKGLWTGKVAWTDARVTQALETFKKMLSYANSDYTALTWDAAAQYLVDGKGAMFIMGDWADGWFSSQKYTGYGWAPVPGTQGIFVALSDSFAAARGARNQANLQDWLKLAGSKEGQEAFNPKKGSICARTDCDPALFDAYLQSAMQDWSQDAIVPSVAHGAAAIETWATIYKEIIVKFAAEGNVAVTQAALQQACAFSGVCK